MGMIDLVRSLVPHYMRGHLDNFYRFILLFIPAHLRYHPDYFEVMRLLVLIENGNKEIISPVLAQRLALVLRDAVSYVPYYRETIKIQANDIDESNVFEVLKEFPYLHKETVMNDTSFFLDERYPKRKLKYSTSGGSTGQGIGIWSDRRERQVETAFFDYEWGKLGYVRGRSKVIRFGVEARKKKDDIPWSQKGNRLLISPYHLNEQWLAKIYSRILDFEPEFIHTYPSCLEMLARFILDKGLSKISVKGLFLASEAFTEFQYDLFKSVFNAPIKAHYGLCEKTNLAFMQESENKTTFYYKLNPVYGFTENLPDEHGYQEIVGTSYWNKIMPLIRYRTQDFGHVEQDGIIHKLDGRNQEFLFTRNGEKIPGFSIKIDEFTWDYVSVYQVVQESKGSIILRVIPRSNFNEEIKKIILEKQREKWGEFFDIQIELVEEIPRTISGKQRLVVNLINDKK